METLMQETLMVSISVVTVLPAILRIVLYRQLGQCFLPALQPQFLIMQMIVTHTAQLTSR